MIDPLLLAILAASTASTPTSSPLEPARAGQVQCYAPAEAKKTCHSLASYKWIAGARYANTALVPISETGPTILETTTLVEVKAGAVCGQIRSEDVVRGKLMVGGRTLASDEAAPILARVAQSMAPMAGKEICTSYVPSGADWAAKVSIDGVYRADADQRVKWVKPSDGYTVSP